MTLHRPCPCCGRQIEKEQEEDSYSCSHCGWEENADA